jgi:predicted ABC-type ATPase
MNKLRRLIRSLLIETYVNQSSPKLIFLAGTPGGGKSTAVRNLGLDGLFTVCNPDEFYEALLKQNQVPLDLAGLMDEYTKMKRLANNPDYVMSTTELQRWDWLQEKVSLQTTLMFQGAMPQYNSKVERLLAEGRNIILDGTCGNLKKTLAKKALYEEMGYSVGMIAIDITVETAKERNISRGQEGGRTLAPFILDRVASQLERNYPIYQAEFDHFWLVDNKGTFDEYRENILGIREDVLAWVNS